MQAPVNRRAFLQKSSVLTGGLAAVTNFPALAKVRNPNEKLLIGIIGCSNRGMNHIAGFSSVPNTEIAYICDVDSRAASKGMDAAAKKQGTIPKAITDLRRMLEDPTLDAVSIATPDHWHTPAAILACAAGKHVYLEKPGSHNARESEVIVAAARKHKRVVQMGNQRRSWPWVIEAVNALHAGEIGKLYFARAWYTTHRDSIGRGKHVPVPDWLDFSLWQGPAPEQPFRDNILHYNWHWFWNWGTGELGNNGVHGLDLARWALGVDAPQRITCGGNRYHFHDDWETPDIYVVSFDFGNCGITWEGQSCDPRGFEGMQFGVNFYGEKGSLVIAGYDYSIYDLNNKLVRQTKGKYDDVVHFANFAAGIREGQTLNSEIEDGQKSTLLCHLGNIAWRTGHTLNFDKNTGKILDDHKASALWTREYRRGWEPKV
jgi:predicted dehydrogenase